MKHVFITGTDTGIGKSIFSALLALKYLNEGKKVAISKPLQTGFPKDTDFLKKLTGNKVPIFNTYSFSLGASPSVASEYENKTIEVEKIISDIRELEKEFDYVIVEGIGGIAVPITSYVIVRNEVTNNDVYLVVDLIKALNYPIIIIARPSLGTINHTVLTIEFARQKGLDVLGFVVSGYDKNTSNQVMKTAPDVIYSITGVNCLIKIPSIKKLDFESINLIAENYELLVTSDESLSSNTPSCLANT